MLVYWVRGFVCDIFQISQQPKGDLEKNKHSLKLLLVKGYFSAVELAKLQFCFN